MDRGLFFKQANFTNIDITTTITNAILQRACAEDSVSSDYWRGYCDCYDVVQGQGQEKGITWALVKARIEDFEAGNYE